MKSRTSAVGNKNNGSNEGVGAMAGIAGVSMLSGAGGTTITTCKDGDTSFYCQFTKWFNILKMLLFIVVLIVVIYFLAKWWMSSKKK